MQISRTPNSAHKTKTGISSYFKKSQITREHIVNRVSSYFFKGSHSATETLTLKQAIDYQNKTTALEQSIMNGGGGGGGGGGVGGGGLK